MELQDEIKLNLILAEDEVRYLKQCQKVGRYIPRDIIANCTTCKYGYISSETIGTSPCPTCKKDGKNFSNWEYNS